MEFITKIVGNGYVDALVIISLIGIITFLFFGGTLGNIVSNVSNGFLG